MSADESVMERERVIVHGSGYVADGAHQQFGIGEHDDPTAPLTRGQPTHFGGCSVHLENPSDTTVTVTIDDSDDGTTWTPVLFSDPGNGGLLNTTIVGLGEQALLFETTRRYYRISFTPAVSDGGVAYALYLFADIVQRPPRGSFASEEY